MMEKIIDNASLEKQVVHLTNAHLKTYFFDNSKYCAMFLSTLSFTYQLYQTATILMIIET